MIDLHCHILPNLDDGPQSQEESIAMGRRAMEDGVHTIVATPHTLNGIYINHIQQVISDVATLQEALSKNHIDLRLYAGADVHLCPGLLQRIESGEAGTIDDAKRYILLEFPSQTIPSGIKDEIFSLKVHGITPIITHPERHPLLHHDMDILYELVRMGALCQMTAMSIAGDFGGVVMRCAEILLRNRLIHLIASDAHSPDSRPPILSQAVETAAEIMGSYEDAERMVTDVPAAILSGDAVEVPEPTFAKGV
ncbi:MAG: CpsB/CapC family capsule biosynthesis tyrosine phosphatase [Pseudomonadota bacterium]